MTDKNNSTPVDVESESIKIISEIIANTRAEKVAPQIFLLANLEVAIRNDAREKICSGVRDFDEASAGEVVEAIRDGAWT